MIDPSTGADGENARIRVAVLGCSGSIGRQTLDVCRRHRDRVSVVALSVNSSTGELVAAAREFGPFLGAFLCPPSLINSAKGFTIVSLSSHILEG